MKEALKLALDYIVATNKSSGFWLVPASNLNNVVTAIKEALAQPPLPMQEPVAWMTINEYGDEDDIHYANPEGHLLDGWTYKPLYTHPPTVQPAQEAIYGMNQDDWKDVVAAIAKVRDGRGIYLACRPADVFQDWFLALGIAKVKEKNFD